jgi:hypothetical protein
MLGFSMGKTQGVVGKLLETYESLVKYGKIY